MGCGLDIDGRRNHPRAHTRGKTQTRYVVPKLPPLAFIAIAKLLPSRMTDNIVKRIIKL